MSEDEVQRPHIMAPSPHIRMEDIWLLVELQRIADAKYDGHLTICKFTTNWRIGFETPTSRDDIHEMHDGDTFGAAARKAIQASAKKPVTRKWLRGASE